MKQKQNKIDLLSKMNILIQSVGILKQSQSHLKSDVSMQLRDLGTRMKGEITPQVKASMFKLVQGWDAMSVKYKKELVERKKLHNIVQELKGNIRVYMRYVLCVDVYCVYTYIPNSNTNPLPVPLLTYILTYILTNTSQHIYIHTDAVLLQREKSTSSEMMPSVSLFHQLMMVLQWLSRCSMKRDVIRHGNLNKYSITHPHRMVYIRRYRS